MSRLEVKERGMEKGECDILQLTNSEESNFRTDYSHFIVDD